jgi:putative ABC transport system permease protein
MNGIAASTLKLKTGDKVMLETPNGEKEYTIAALATDVLTMKVATAYISQENMKADFNKAENVMVMLDLKDGVDPKAVLPKINEVLKDYPQMSAKITGEYREFLLTYTVSALKIFYVLAFLIIFPAALGLLNTLTINVLERTREIGVTRAIGASRGQVRRIVLAEALLLGLFGVLMGIVAGVALSYGFTSAISSVGWILPYSVPIGGIIGALVVSIILALLAAILPARSAARMDIMRALQYE